MLKIVNNEIGVPVMSSLDMVDYINATREVGKGLLTHDNFVQKCMKVLEGSVIQFKDTYKHPQNGQEYVYFKFPEREAMLMAMSYSHKLQAQVYDAWIVAKEAIKVPAFQLPNFDDKMEMAKFYIESVQRDKDNYIQITKIEEQLKESLPALEFQKAYVECSGTKCLGDVAKLFGFKPQTFNKMMAADDILFKRSGNWVAYSPHTDAGRFIVKTGYNVGHAFTQTYVTPLGISWLAKKYLGKQAAILKLAA